MPAGLGHANERSSRRWVSRLCCRSDTNNAVWGRQSTLSSARMHSIERLLDQTIAGPQPDDPELPDLPERSEPREQGGRSAALRQRSDGSLAV